MISSVNTLGRVAVSPPGDPNGFVDILDNQTLLIPERPGNKRAETFKNILHNPNVGLIFIIPTKGESLRISGKARIVRDTEFRERFIINNKMPAFLLAIHVEEAYFHCGKAMTRSKMWQPDHWKNIDHLVRLGETMVDAGQLSISQQEMQKIVDDDEADRLY